MERFLNIDWLKKNHKMVHYFGLGFIQLKLNDAERLHFYTDDLPGIVGPEEIHNHRYDFKSTIVKGVLAQYVYNIIPGTKYTKRQESCQEGIEIVQEEVLCDKELNSTHTYREKSEYFIKAHTFHRVVAVTECVTHLYRSNYTQKHSEVVSLVGAPKVCPFSQKVDEEKLWEIIDRMIK